MYLNSMPEVQPKDWDVPGTIIDLDILSKGSGLTWWGYVRLYILFDVIENDFFH